MTNIEELKESAIESCEEARDHTMGPWHIRSHFHQGDHKYICFCKTCDAYVEVNTKPMPNEIEIGGPAVAVDCASYLDMKGGDSDDTGGSNTRTSEEVASRSQNSR